MEFASVFRALALGVALAATAAGSTVVLAQDVIPILPAPELPSVPATINPVDPKVTEEQYQRGHDALIAGYKEQAIGEFIESCDGGNLKSCFNVGLLHEEKIKGDPSNDPNFKTAIAYMVRACFAGFQRACIAEASNYRTPKYGVLDVARSVALLTKACDAGEIAGCEDLAEIHHSGSGIPVDVARAAALFKQSCDAGGRANSCFNYGLLRSKGHGEAASLEEAIQYYRLGCRKGSNDACTNLAAHYLRPDASLPELGIGAGLLRHSCANGGLIACSNMGQVHREGKVSDASNAEAVSFFRKACDGGYGSGCRSLGNMTEEGIKEAGPKRAALKHYIRGCNLKYAESCYNVGLVYWLGFRAPKRIRTSIAWYGKGCEMGSASSCAGASIAALSLKECDPAGGKAAARPWFDRARVTNPENGLVKSLEAWRSKVDENEPSPTCAGKSKMMPAKDVAAATFGMRYTPIGSRLSNQLYWEIATDGKGEIGIPLNLTFTANDPDFQFDEGVHAFDIGTEGYAFLQKLFANILKGDVTTCPLAAENLDYKLQWDDLPALQLSWMEADTVRTFVFDTTCMTADKNEIAQQFDRAWKLIGERMLAAGQGGVRRK
jgi:uncharacterized protein